MGEASISPVGAHAQETALGGERLLEVIPELAGLFPESGLRRGGVVGLSGAAGSTSLFLALLARPLALGSWAGVVGIPGLGLECAAGLGLSLERLVLVPQPGRRWPEVVAAMLDAFDLVVTCPPPHCRPGDARRLVARARERRSLLVVTKPPALGRSYSTAPARWPEGVDLRLDVVAAQFTGLQAGHGTLRGRRVTLASSGRGAAARERRVQLWLPGPDGAAGGVEDRNAVAPAPVPAPAATPARTFAG